jgi:hypothetical protein
MGTHDHWGIPVVLAVAWIGFFIWQWRWRGFDAFASEHRGWGIAAGIAFVLIAALLILNNF